MFGSRDPSLKPWYGDTIDKSVSVIVPTYHEADNIEPLTWAVFEALNAHKIEGEIIFVDDNSKDGTIEKVKELSERGYHVSVIVRTNARGLSSAVLRGFEAAQERILVVMDADLQHPPEFLPDIINPLITGKSDFVIGSRYVAGGQIGEWSLLRKIISLGASALAMPLARGMKDPMAGFFGIRKELFLAHKSQINPIGFKIGLELLVKCTPEYPQEVPITFSQRKMGASKLKLTTQIQYLRQLVSLYWFKSPVIVITALMIALVVSIWSCHIIQRQMIFSL